MTETKGNTDDGGPAFPVMQKRAQFNDDAGSWSNVYEPVGGMSLRDYFAGQALVIWAPNANLQAVGQESEKSGLLLAQGLALACYELADAMIAQRKVQS